MRTIRDRTISLEALKTECYTQLIRTWMGVSLWKTCEPSSDFDCDAPMVDGGREQVASVALTSACGGSC